MGDSKPKMVDSKPKMLKPEVNSQVSGYGANNPIFNGENNPGGNQIQGGNFNGPFNIGGTHSTNQNNKQTGGGGNNPQLQGDQIYSGVKAADGVGSKTQKGDPINSGVKAADGVGSKTRK